MNELEDVPDLSGLSVRGLLGLYASIVTELTSRGVVRSRSAPAGDYAEWLVARAYQGTLAPPSEKSWDVATPDGQLLQVKCRVISPSTSPSAVYSVFRSWDFDRCILIRFTPDYSIDSAVDIPRDALQARSRFRAHVAGSAIRVSTKFAPEDGATDITALLETITTTS